MPGSAGESGNGRMLVFRECGRVKKAIPGVEADAIFRQRNELGIRGCGFIDQGEAGRDILFDIGRGGVLDAGNFEGPGHEGHSTVGRSFIQQLFPTRHPDESQGPALDVCQLKLDSGFRRNDDEMSFN
jgi:hypothetical protein